MILVCASFLSSVLTFPIRVLAGLLSRVAPSQKAKIFFYERTEEYFTKQLLNAENQNRAATNDKRATFWLHVSSAGELEQVIPVMRSLHDELSVQFFVTYFSPSTKPFLKNVPGVIGGVSLPAEDKSKYSRIITKLGIRRLLLVRYDFWPALILTAHKHGVPVAVLAATLTRARSPLPEQWQMMSKLFWFKQADIVFLVTASDRDRLIEFGFSPDHSIVSGDAKWARAKERAQAQKHNTSAVTTALVQLARGPQSTTRKTIVFGSPHKDEIAILKWCLERLATPCLFVVAPAEVDERTLERLELDLEHGKSRILRLSRLEQSFECTSMTTDTHHVVLILDCFGQLASAYSQADCAIVGGGFDGQLHNVLEPAAYPVLTLFGRKASRAPEAQILLNNNAAIGFDDSEGLFDFLQRWSSLNTSGQGGETHCLEFEQTLEGARTLFGSLPNTSEVICRAIAQRDQLEIG